MLSNNVMTALATGSRCVHSEEEEEYYKLWPAVMLAVMLYSNQLPQILSHRC